MGGFEIAFWREKKRVATVPDSVNRKLTHSMNNLLIGDFSREVGGEVGQLRAVEQAETLL